MRLPLLMERGVQLDRAHDDVIREGNDSAAYAALLEGGDLAGRVLRLEPAENFVAREDREAEVTLRGKVLPSVLLDGGVATLDDFGKRVGVQQSHSCCHQSFCAMK